ncbi:DNA polymerase alpha/epsilon subunit B-domain-containing protein [Gamsiella multidivaricata]|uniref:DNA polymerase alpha/epsilon subunit B-domain-containing protein n=1 Tax=Gamsiella multidivaricata TaxID=101098 RepID=UPI00221FEB2B|nr:DNA polymerase alpha/epsilon subunit B-domain-containing protein [Gamsiella multidivaricata]KAI7817596.1 DNA polymerase alpha/epsilon subunit B-domain-containing protein [Gamsiella multidivaricata]
MSIMETESASIERRKAAFDNLGSLQRNFLVDSREYKLQYAHLYFTRLVLMRPKVLKQAKLKWGSLDSTPKHVEKVLDVQPGEISYLIGTVYMDMKLKPNILNDITKDHWITAQPDRPKYTDDDDSVYLEDESGRVKLTGAKITSVIFVTGVVMGVLGSEDINGDFKVVDVCYAVQPPQQPLSLMETDEADKYVALISGLRIGGDSFKPLEMDLLAEYLTGEIGGLERCDYVYNLHPELIFSSTPLQEQAEGANLVRVIIAGNSIVTPEIVEDDTKTKKYGYDRSTFVAESTAILDRFLQDVCSSVHVDIMPGDRDPSSISMPQQPIHPALLQSAREYSTFQSVTNPYWSSVDNVTMLGTSGQTIDDIYKYIKSEDRLEMAKKTLSWGHVAPTTPDTLWCYPFGDKDPFIMEQVPHVYFVGNQDKFATELVIGMEGQRTRVVMLPPFASTGTIAMVNLRTLECRSVSFSTGSKK